MLEKIIQKQFLKKSVLQMVISAGLVACAVDETSPRPESSKINGVSYSDVVQSKDSSSSIGCDLKAYFKDADKDKYGDKNKVIYQCPLSGGSSPAGYVDNDLDFDDDDFHSYLGAPELCDKKDNNGNGVVDDGVAYVKFFKDIDGDGHGNPAIFVVDCKQPAEFVTNNVDCNDSDKNTYPGAKEICDGKANDCGLLVDAGLEDVVACGFNGKGKQKQVCAEAKWVDTGICDDPDVCKNGISETKNCGFGDSGTAKYTCVKGQWLPGTCAEPYGCTSSVSKAQVQPDGSYVSAVSGRFYAHPTGIIINSGDTVKGTATGKVNWNSTVWNGAYNNGPDQTGNTWGLKVGCKGLVLSDLGSTFNSKVYCSGELYFFVPDGNSSSSCVSNFYSDNAGGFDVKFEIKN